MEKFIVTIGDKSFECVSSNFEYTGKITYEIHTEHGICSFETEQEAADFANTLDIPFRFAEVKEIKS